MPQGKLAGCTVLQNDVSLNYTTHYLSWGMLPSAAVRVTPYDSINVLGALKMMGSLVY